MNEIGWAHAGPPVLAAFLASAVEFVEALTVILAVGTVRGWRDALLGAGAATCMLLVAVAAFGAALARIPLGVLQLAVGALLLLFGLRWLRKAVLRAAGVIPVRDEAAAFAKQSAALRGHQVAEGWDSVAFGTAFQITLLEGTEVVFIVLAVGAGGVGLLLPASLGALAALALVAAVGVLVRRPLSRVPENGLKFTVGVLLSAFGTFWFGEGAGIGWPGGDWSLLALVGGFLAAALATARLCQSRLSSLPALPDAPRGGGSMNRSLAVLRHGFGLLVDDGRLALATLAWLLLCGLVLPQLARGTGWGGLVLFAGLAVILAESAARRARPPT